jgi:hypothetical protein
MIPRHGDVSDDPDMAEQRVPDEVWAAIQPLLSPKRPIPKAADPGPRTKRSGRDYLVESTRSVLIRSPVFVAQF